MLNMGDPHQMAPTFFCAGILKGILERSCFVHRLLIFAPQIRNPSNRELVHWNGHLAKLMGFLVYWTELHTAPELKHYPAPLESILLATALANVSRCSSLPSSNRSYFASLTEIQYLLGLISTSWCYLKWEQYFENAPWFSPEFIQIALTITFILMFIRPTSKTFCIILPTVLTVWQTFQAFLGLQRFQDWMEILLL